MQWSTIYRTKIKKEININESIFGRIWCSCCSCNRNYDYCCFATPLGNKIRDGIVETVTKLTEKMKTGLAVQDGSALSPGIGG